MWSKYCFEIKVAEIHKFRLVSYNDVTIIVNKFGKK